VTLPYDNLNDIRLRLGEVAPNLTRYGDREDANYVAQALQLAQVSRIDEFTAEYEKILSTIFCRKMLNTLTIAIAASPLSHLVWKGDS
jgi:hypothetical protein